MKLISNATSLIARSPGHMLKKFCLSILICGFSLSGQEKDRPIKLLGIEIQGTHLPRNSIVRLLGLTVGQMVTKDVLLDACSRVTHTGLVGTIDLSFLQTSDGSGASVVFTLSDELPLLPASVVPLANENAAWGCLQGGDGIFLRQLPNTKEALQFYAANLNKCITQTSERPLHAEAHVICDSNLKPTRIEFRIEPGAAEGEVSSTSHK